jgi:23S rRNA (uracil1939-C5)-methyltransferase
MTRSAIKGGRTRSLDTTIAELSPGGEGVAIEEIDGERRAIFVPGVVKGERVRVEADLSRRPARARLLEVLQPSAARVGPECPWFEACGGCDWMHLSLEEQARSHAAIVAAVLPPAFRGVDVITHRALRGRGYRTRARIHVDARRGRVIAGMYGRGSHAPVSVETCLVLDPVLDRARAALPAWLEGARGRGEAQLALGKPTAERKAVIDLRWTGELPAAVFGRFERAVAEGAVAGARLYAGDVRVPATIGDATPWIMGGDGAPLRLSPGGFSQATEEGNVELARRTVALADAIAPGATTLELFAGAGNLTVLFAQTRTITAVEIVREACDAARANLAARGLSARVRVIEGDAGTHPIGRDAKLVVLDPPRAGAKEAVRMLASRLPSHSRPAIVYVSCDPPTLGRDLSTLADAGYQLAAIETFEMFPHTSHVETIAALVPPPGNAKAKERKP